MASRLPNYLKTYRKRAGLSQDEVAFLLGCQSGAKVSRYERLARQPSLETILAYEVLFGTPASELFAGVYAKVEQRLKRRVRRMIARLSEDKPTKRTLRKLAALNALLGPAVHQDEKAT